ncbi:hypothetical protein LCGC14_2578250, partial [marine sediment metagenome]
MARRKAGDDLKTRIAEIVLQSAIPYLPGWMETLGKLGSPPEKGEPIIDPRSRVSAAKTGVDFVTKFIGDAGASAAGKDLLEELEKIGRAADPEPSESGSRPEDP